jgi:hypothetical protein
MNAETEEYNRPHNLLRNAYKQYIIAKKCYEELHISKAQMVGARKAVRGIEAGLKPKLEPGFSVEALWAAADREAQPYTTEAFNDWRNNSWVTVRVLCADSLRFLQALHPESLRTPKDF